MLSMTSSKLRLSCRINWSNTLNSKSKTIFLITPIKLKKFSIASVSIIVNVIVELPNSTISCSYLCDTSSVTTFLVISNVVSERPNCLTMVLMNAKKYAVVLRITHIFCQFLQALSVSSQLRASAMLQELLATIT